MSRARAAGAAALLAAPCVLAFFSGGFFDEARLWAGLGAWALVALGAFGGLPPIRRSGAVAAAALAGLCAWTALAAGWAPLAGPALADLQRLVLYLGAFVAGLLLLPALPRAVEPALASGCTVVIGYGVAGRVLPGVVEQAASGSAFGRLEQPLTYWNATGLVAAMGLVLALGLAGDPSRPRGMRAGASAAVPLLACGLVLSFSRGALLACAVGAIALAALAPGRLRPGMGALACAVPAAGVALWLDGVRALGGGPAAREREGLVMLAVLVAASVVAGWLAARRTRRLGGKERARGIRRFVIAPAAVLLAVVAAAAGGGGSRAEAPATGATPARLLSAGSDRYDYWAVAVDAWRADPLTGTGPGGFRVAWLRERPVPARAQDAHSLYLETLAELGLVGAALLVVFMAAMAVAAARAPLARAGAVAALAVWAVHAGLDWDWEMPAVTLPALLLAAHLAAAPAAAPAPRTRATAR